MCGRGGGESYVSQDLQQGRGFPELFALQYQENGGGHVVEAKHAQARTERTGRPCGWISQLDNKIKGMKTVI